MDFDTMILGPITRFSYGVESFWSNRFGEFVGQSRCQAEIPLFLESEETGVIRVTSPKGATNSLMIGY